MAVEIRELIIKAVVDDKEENDPSEEGSAAAGDKKETASEASKSPAPESVDMEKFIAEAVEQTFTALERKKER